MLLELRQSSVAREGMGAACSATVELLAHLATEEATADSVGALWRHGRKPKRAALDQVLALSVSQRGELLEAVSSDLQFADRFDDPGFRFRFPALDPETRSAGKNLLVSMYEEVFCHRTGFLFGTEGQANRATWESAYREANPEGQLCPACAASRLEDPVIGRTMVDADHYLPKATYPALAVHGLNLVPLCKQCNSVLKGSQDPLSGLDGGSGLPDMWFPYRRPGVAEIGLSFDPAKEPKQQVDFSGSDAARGRAKRFDAMFHLRERWSTMLTGIQQTLPDELKTVEATSDLAGVRAGLRLLQRLAEVGKAADTRAFVKSNYYAWLLENDAALEILAQQLGQRPGPDPPP